MPGEGWNPTLGGSRVCLLPDLGGFSGGLVAELRLGAPPHTHPSRQEQGVGGIRFLLDWRE